MEGYTITEITEIKKPTYIPMSEMKPGQFGVLSTGEYVIRTLSLDNFEVMSLSELEEDNCWERNPESIQVQLLDELTVTFRRIK